MTQFNSGMMMTLVFLALILLRPVLVPLLRPRHRVVLWFVGFALAYLIPGWELLCRVPALPVSFLSLLAPLLPPGRALSPEDGSGRCLIPQFFSHTLEHSPEGWEQTYFLDLPGLPPLSFTTEAKNWLFCGVIAGIFVFLVCALWYDHCVRLLAESGSLAPCRLKNAEVRIYDGLSTNFVCYGVGKGKSRSFLICLQKELSPEYFPLVLLHEGTHIRMHHVWYKWIIVCALALYWWNPVYWLTYRLACRDMELACDEAVMDVLDAKGRRNYARALVELGSGRRLWGSVSSFGECDAALRVKRAAAWTPRSKLRDSLSLAGTVLLIAFFYLGTWY